MITLLKAQLRRSLKSVPTVEAQDAVSAALGSMLANQMAAAKARAAHPDPEWAEAQARAEYHHEEAAWESALGRDEGDE